MNQTLDEQIEDYLNGQLSGEETRRFETNLLDKKVSTAFNEALIIRELLSNLPSDELPPGMIDRIETSLDLSSSPPTRKAKPKKFSRLSHIASGFRWGLLWPGYALAGISSSSSKLKSSLSGIDTIGYSLGPLNEPVRNRASNFRWSTKPLWKIALSKLW
jgi:hypothetical protein